MLLESRGFLVKTSLFGWRALRLSRRLLTAAVTTLLIVSLGLSSWSPAVARDLPAQPNEPAARDLTFFVVSDTHYGLSPRGDETLPLLVDKMNGLPGMKYPDEIGGETIAPPHGVLHIGDITNDAKEKQWDLFVHDYGLTGKEGKLHFPVYERFGNHDGGSKNIVRKSIKERNPGRVGLKTISENGLFYSWDWEGIHFVSLGISPGTTCHPYDQRREGFFPAK